MKLYIFVGLLSAASGTAVSQGIVVNKLNLEGIGPSEPEARLDFEKKKEKMLKELLKTCAVPQVISTKEDQLKCALTSDKKSQCSTLFQYSCSEPSKIPSGLMMYNVTTNSTTLPTMTSSTYYTTQSSFVTQTTIPSSSTAKSSSTSSKTSSKTSTVSSSKTPTRTSSKTSTVSSSKTPTRTSSKTSTVSSSKTPTVSSSKTATAIPTTTYPTVSSITSTTVTYGGQCLKVEDGHKNINLQEYSTEASALVEAKYLGSTSSFSAKLTGKHSVSQTGEVKGVVEAPVCVVGGPKPCPGSRTLTGSVTCTTTFSASVGGTFQLKASIFVASADVKVSGVGTSTLTLESTKKISGIETLNGEQICNMTDPDAVALWYATSGQAVKETCAKNADTIGNYFMVLPKKVLPPPKPGKCYNLSPCIQNGSGNYCNKNWDDDEEEEGTCMWVYMNGEGPCTNGGIGGGAAGAARPCRPEIKTLHEPSTNRLKCMANPPGFNPVGKMVCRPEGWNPN